MDEHGLSDQSLWQIYAWPERCVRVNFVTSLNGAVEDAHGKSGGLSSAEDRRIFHMLRAGCDAVLVGGETARREGYVQVPIKEPWQRYRSDQGPPPVFVVSRSPLATDTTGGSGVSRIALAEVPSVMETFPRLLCEGGPRLFTSLLGSGLVDQLALSIRGHLGGSGNLLAGDVSVGGVLKHAHTADDTIFTLWDLK